MMERLLPTRRSTAPGRRAPMRTPMDMFEMFEDMWRSPFRGLEELDQQFTPAIEVSEKDNEVVVRAEVPGMKPEDMDIRVENNHLILSGEKKQEHKDEKENNVHMEFSYGRFYRTIPLRGEVNPENIKAKYKDGVLTVNVPLDAESTTAKKIAIES
ncbi:Hsp20/alpha crystallin family protein [Desulfonatronospira sp.]|uniref:Hsp20/alpha crystallin family protein n=1 Tax=Desulfonatronospira sp. TaxID=1962951 RepID=UPI0025C68E3D|nr:Hsp20/alpha crystallin family protein [Desulfonatronospira sp.]